MVVRFDSYDLGFRFVSIAMDAFARDRLLARGLNVLFLEEGRTRLLPQGVLLDIEGGPDKLFGALNDFDVCSIWQDGSLHRVYDDASNDNYLFITGRCNSNCIMCPSPVEARMRSPKANIKELMELAGYIPSDVAHLTITGGEPFLAGLGIFDLLGVLKERFERTDFLVLTNGRVFAIERYVRLLLERAPENILLAIPLHGSCPELHDRITQAPGSFEQTFRGIKSLLRNDIPVELRLVVSKLNVDDFGCMADMILSEFQGIEYVSVIAMEMTGAARVHRDAVWIPYRKAFDSIRAAIYKLLMGGVDVKLYNFPLCTVDSGYWTLCEKSISPSKARYAPMCDRCRYRTSCGGVFAGTLGLEKDELEVLS